jgi:hypothetical protein
MQNTLKQAQYSQTQKANPGQRNLKHMMNRKATDIMLLERTHDKLRAFLQQRIPRLHGVSGILNVAGI